MPDVPQYTHPPRRPLDINVEPPAYEEIAKTVLSLKSGKAQGLDLRTAGMLKAEITFAVKVLTPFGKIWMREELPDDWNKALLITVPKTILSSI